jgi:hypothetical protein
VEHTGQDLVHWRTDLMALGAAEATDARRLPSAA